MKYYCKDCDFKTDRRVKIDSHYHSSGHKFGIRLQRRYEVYIKSHTEAPDYEDWCTAQNRKEATKILTKRVNSTSGRRPDGDFWSEEDFEKFVYFVPKGRRR